MLKKLVAMTLVALMIINPMTAFAVSWGDMLVGLEEARQQSKNSYTQEGVTLEVEGTNAKIYGDGLLTDFYQVDKFTNYTFSGNITIGGEKFEVYVWGDQQVVVNIESGVGVTANEVRFGVDDNAALKVTTKGNIGFDAEGNLVTEHIALDVSEAANEKASLEFVNEGDLAVSGDIWMSVDGEGKLVVTNDGGMTANKEIGLHVHGDSEAEFTNNGTLASNALGEESEDYQFGIGVHGNGSATVINGEDGTIDGNVSGWLDSDSTGGSVSSTNEGTVTGDVGAWGFEGYEDEEGNYVASSGSIELDNQGAVGGNLGTFTRDDTSTTITNSGTVEGEMFADNMGSQDMTMTNSGDVNSLFANNNGGANATVTNSGSVLGGEARVEAGSGSLSFSNTGTIDGGRFDAHAYGEGTVSGSNTGTIDVEWGYVGSSENGNSSFTNESEGYIHTDENFDINAGNWPGDENYPGLNPENSSSTSFVNSGDVVTEGSFAGNLFENGSVTLENTSEGTMTAVNEGIHISNSSNGEGSVSVNNAGTVNSEWFNVGSQTTGEASISNSATVNGYMGAYADGVYDDEGNLIEANKDGKVTVSNSGTVNGGMGSYVNGGTGTVINTGTAIDVNADAEGEGASVNLTNDGTAEFVHVGAYEGATGTAVNTGTVTGELQNTAGNGGTSSAVNDGETNGMWSHADEGGSVSSTNNGSAINQGGYSESDGSLVTIMNNGTVEGWLEGYMYGNGSTEVVNNGDVGIKVQGIAGGEGSVADVVNTENGTADTAWLDAHGGELAMNNEGAVSGTLSVSIGTQSNAVTGTDTVAQLLEQTGLNISGYENVDIYTTNENGELIARYSVDENGEVVLEEVLLVEEGVDNNDPRFWTEERIRHQKEEERKAAAIGGVTASPYRVKQLYLGYMSLNLRLFDGEDQLLFKESLSWVPGTGKAGEKILTLNVGIEDTHALMMRLDGVVIDKLEQADITVIRIVDGMGNLFMEYKVEDLKDAREMVGLTAKEYIVVGSADADVMKIAEDGTISPIESENEAEPVEEVAEEAKETAEEAAEETPAA